MNSKIFFSLIALLAIYTGTAFGQEYLISVQTNDENYEEGDTIVISGQVATKIGETPVLLQIIQEGSIIEIAQITVSQDGSFTKTIIAEPPIWRIQGNYTIKAFYQEYEAETEFSFIPKSAAAVTTTNYEVDAGSHGTFDVKYTIKGANIKDMVIDSDIFALIVHIEPTDEGSVTLELPREFIGAEKQDGKDDTFIILIDGIEVPYEESAVHSETRVITINFEEGDSDIEVIGTYVIPEFGAIVTMVLIVGIMATIAVTRNKFQTNF